MHVYTELDLLIYSDFYVGFSENSPIIWVLVKRRERKRRRREEKEEEEERRRKRLFQGYLEYRPTPASLPRSAPPPPPSGVFFEDPVNHAPSEASSEGRRPD